MNRRIIGRPGLTTEQIGAIYLAFLAGEPKSHIAIQLDIDRKTVIKYLRPVQNLTDAMIIDRLHSLPGKTCHQGHTSLKCLVCGQTSDNIKSEEYQLIIRLRDRVRALEHQIENLHATPIHSQLANPIVRISL